MRHDPSNLRPETHALSALIQATVEQAQAKSKTGEGLADTLLFMGNSHQAIPTLVVQDPILEPVDKVVWMVILMQARITGGPAAFPSYDTIAKNTNVGSTSTISRAIAILRVTRWLTLCARVRDDHGQFRGNVYALHDEPLPLIDALYLDADYMAFVQQSVAHHHARVCRVAQGVLDSLDEDIQAGYDVTAPMSSLERRAHTALSLQAKTRQRSIDFTTSVVTRLHNVKQQLRKHQDQNSKAVEKSLTGSSCSHFYKKTTTTTVPDNEEANQGKMPASHDRLIYPSRFTSNQRALADRYLAMVDAELHQVLLDELQGRLASERKGMQPVYDELRFLHSLCTAAQKGEFVPNLGIRVSEERAHPPKEPSEECAQDQLPLLANPPIAEKQPATQKGEEQLKALRQSLGLSTE